MTLSRAISRSLTGAMSRTVARSGEAGGGGAAGDFILMEDGTSFLMLEDGVSFVQMESIVTPSDNGLLMEDGSSFLMLEDGISYLLKEAA